MSQEAQEVQNTEEGEDATTTEGAAPEVTEAEAA